MRHITNRLTYANVTATLALFIALGGSSYAALTLPRNSVGANQIRTGAVSSSEIKNRGIRLGDLSVSARRALQGGAGPTGAPGPAGTPAARYFAVVNAAGAAQRGNATSGGRSSEIGRYDFGFASSVSGCAFSATIGGADGTVQPPGRATVSDNGGRAGVQTYDSAGNPADLPFHLVIAC